MKRNLVRRFGIPHQINDKSWHACCLIASELLRMYSITVPQNHPNSTLQYHTMDNLLDDAGLTHIHIQESKHKLLFIKFAPCSTLIPRWYLNQVDLDITLSM